MYLNIISFIFLSWVVIDLTVTLDDLNKPNCKIK
jgi:hypothetical protein